MPTVLLAALAATLLALAHIGTPLLDRLAGTPRSIWLSVAGGVAVSYVFLHLLPELADGQRHLGAALGPGGTAPMPWLAAIERHVYLVALLGLAAFYGLERLAIRSRADETEEGGDDDERGVAVGVGRAGGEQETRADATTSGVFWVHMASFALYNALVGYLLLHGEHEGPGTLALFTVAMALHFLVTDFGLYEHHQQRYHQVGRWLLAAAVLVGFGVAVAYELPRAAVAGLIAFLAGGVILNVLKEEVPSERQSRFWAFAVGLGAYAVLLLAM